MVGRLYSPLTYHQRGLCNKTSTSGVSSYWKAIALPILTGLMERSRPVLPKAKTLSKVDRPKTWQISPHATPNFTTTVSLKPRTSEMIGSASSFSNTLSKPTRVHVGERRLIIPLRILPSVLTPTVSQNIDTHAATICHKRFLK